MKTFLLLTLLSLYFCRYCHEITSANGVDDCKNQEIEYDDSSSEDLEQKNCCYYNGMFVDGTFSEGTGCTALTTAEEEMLKSLVQGLIDAGQEINITLICSPRDETTETNENEETKENEESKSTSKSTNETTKNEGSKSTNETTKNEEDSSSNIKNLTFQNKNYLCILFLSMLLI